MKRIQNGSTRQFDYNNKHKMEKEKRRPEVTFLMNSTDVQMVSIELRLPFNTKDVQHSG